MGVPLIENSNLKRKMKSADRISVFRGVWFPRPTLVWPGSVVKSETPKWANQRLVSRSFAYRQFDWIFIEIANLFSHSFAWWMNARWCNKRRRIIHERHLAEKNFSSHEGAEVGRFFFFSRLVIRSSAESGAVDGILFSEANDTHRQFQPFRRLKCKMNQVPPGGLDWISLVFSRMNVTSPPGGTLIWK